MRGRKRRGYFCLDGGINGFLFIYFHNKKIILKRQNRLIQYGIVGNLF
jgi:hypothetical protein